MADVHGSESGNAHTHTHSDNCEEELSAKYAEYVEEHLEELRTECKKINTCVDELLADENIITIINGYDLNIKKTCSLVYQSGSETIRNSTKRCTPKDREHIHGDFEDHLTYQLETEKPAWKNVSKCLEKNYGNSITTATNVEKICGLAYNRTQICNANTHKTIRDFFNDQIHHLKCTCKALQLNDGSGKFSMPVLIASVAGGILLLFILCAIVGFICYRRKKSKKRQKQASNVVYVPAPNADNYPIYQELVDDKIHPGFKQPPSLNPPSLPARYTPMANSSDGTQFTVCEDTQGYLEPVAASSRLKPNLPFSGQPNPGYGIPTEYAGVEGMDPANTDSAYFEPVDDEDKGYDTLSRNKASMEAPKPGMVPLGPVPAKRTKKDDRQTESHYFELETHGNNIAEPEY
ncbi:hypothetical protein BsWGS_05947 [Bradybaena similaris]